MDIQSLLGHVNAGKRLEKCLLGHDEVALPELLIEQGAVFREIMSQETWASELTDEQRHRLKKLLPTFSKHDEEDKQETLRMLFAGENFKFGNPLKQFQMKLREGFYAPDIAKYSSLCRKAKRKEYKIRQQRYYAKVLQEILLSRQLVLEEVRHLPPDEPPKFHYTPPPRDNSKESRVRRKYIKILKDVRAECEVEGTSSEEDLPPDRAPPARPKKGAARNLYPIPSPEHPPHSVVSTIAPKPLTNGDTHHADNAPKTKVRPVSPSEVTEDDYLHMLRNHKRRRMECLDTPDLDTQEVTLHDILIRCQAIKRVPTKISPSQGAGAGKKRLKARDKPEKRVKKEKVIKEEVKVEDDALSAASSFRPDDDRSHDSSKPMNISRDENEESLSDYPAHEHQGSHISFGKYNNFFCLLRDLINEFDDAKATTAKMEEKVREWQESPSCSHNAWFSLQTNWVDVVVSALKFLSGDALGLDLDNFIPFLDYKERAQQWKWIGAGRDDDTELLPLFTHWLDNKEENSSDLFEAQGSPPPKKVKTNFVVRPTTQEEKDIFKEQEALRFSNPHKAFTYVLHGYESVVGPVKGVYSKDNAMNKAREHTLLVSDRPSYVTILTLVRDAAARLPNGEGTRGDICELLKDSGFIAPGVTDTQINTVVSGALDRLHYEKDPCVKYEVNRKLWVYLHRNRTEEEFEKIHQAQGAAVKAKKSLQKPKSSRTKTKESSAVPQTSSVPSLPKSSSGSSLIGDSPTEAVTGAPSQPSATGKAAASPRAPKQSPKAPQTTPVRRPPSTPSTPPVRTQVTTQPSLLQTSRPPTAASPGVEALLRGSPQVLASQAVPQLGKSSPLTAHGGKPVTISFMQPGGTGQVPVVTQVKGGKVGPAQALSFNLLPAGDLSGKLAAVAGLTADPNTATLLVSKPDTITRPGKGGVSIPAAALAQTPSTASPTNRSAPSTPPSAPSPVVARLVQQLPQSQVMSVGNLLQGAVQKAANRAAAPGTLKIQGGGMVQSVGGGKPIHLSGKPLSSAKGLVQISGKPGQQTLGLVQTPQGPLSTLNIISPAGMRPGATITRTDTRGVTSASGTILSSALQTGSIVSHSKSNMLQSQNIKVVSQPQVLSQSQAGIVVTQLAPGSLALRPGLQNLSQAKLLNQSGVLPAQFIVQQAPTGLKASDGTTTATPTQGGGIGTPIIVSAPGGKPGQNIQLVKTVLSQHAGLKPGQATILISQPNIPQSVASTISPSTQLLQAVTKASKASPKGKGQPVYARIITPPPGMRLANVSAAGQAITASGVSVVPTMAKSAAAATSVTVTAQPGMGKPADSAPSKQ